MNEGARIRARSPELDAEPAGIDISDEVEALLAEEDVEATDFLLMLGGGLNWVLSDVTRVDAGYRYNRILTDDPAINVNQIHAAIKFRF
jgi:opacity protein-like surface antigen